MVGCVYRYVFMAKLNAVDLIYVVTAITMVMNQYMPATLQFNNKFFTTW